MMRGLQASMRHHARFGWNCLGATNHFPVDPIHVDGFESHAIRRDSGLSTRKNPSA